MKLLLVDDEEMSRQGVAFFLRNALKVDVLEAHNGEEALELFRQNPVPLVISDIRMPKMGGLDLLRALRKLRSDDPPGVILITGFADVDTAVEALREGAYDYLSKPLDTRTLATIISKFREEQGRTKDSGQAHTSPQEQVPLPSGQTISIEGYGSIGAFSQAMRKVVSTSLMLHRDRGVAVILEGETGTGKEVISRLIHHGQGDQTGPFVSVNCSAIAPHLFESELFGYEGGAFTGARREGSPGKLEAAQGGTLLLDEIGDMPLELQPKLLRVLQEREVVRVGGTRPRKLDVRFIAATNRPLERLIQEGRFREDLYYRLNLGRISIPPLRERPDDIAHLAQLFLLQQAESKHKHFRALAPEARQRLLHYTWPGNVRELQNAIERVVLLHDEEILLPEHLDFLFESNLHDQSPDSDSSVPLTSQSFSLPEAGFDLQSFNDQILRRVLKKFDGNKTKAAAYLGMSRSALRRWVDRLDS